MEFEQRLEKNETDTENIEQRLKKNETDTEKNKTDINRLNSDKTYNNWQMSELDKKLKNLTTNLTNLTTDLTKLNKKREEDLATLSTLSTTLEQNMKSKLDENINNLRIELNQYISEQINNASPAGSSNPEECGPGYTPTFDVNGQTICVSVSAEESFSNLFKFKGRKERKIENFSQNLKCKARY
jgi:chromosome segregation ATPase